MWGVAYTVTFGFLGLGWLFDGARMFYIVKQANIKLEEEFEGHGVQQKHLMDAYVLGTVHNEIIQLNYDWFTSVCNVMCYMNKLP